MESWTKEENKETKTTNHINDISEQYNTEEEEPARETDWILNKRSSKKRKAVHSPETEQANSGEKAPEVVKKFQTKEQQPPPINVTGVEDYAKIQSLIKSITSKEYKVTTMNNNVLKINVSDSDTYRALSSKSRQEINQEKVQWYSYENKYELPIRVMARGLHASCNKEEILDEMNIKGLKIIDAWTLLKRKATEWTRWASHYQTWTSNFHANFS